MTPLEIGLIIAVVALVLIEIMLLVAMHRGKKQRDALKKALAEKETRLVELEAEVEELNKKLNEKGFIKKTISVVSEQAAEAANDIDNVKEMIVNSAVAKKSKEIISGAKDKIKKATDEAKESYNKKRDKDRPE